MDINTISIAAINPESALDSRDRRPRARKDDDEQKREGGASGIEAAAEAAADDATLDEGAGRGPQFAPARAGLGQYVNKIV